MLDINKIRNEKKNVEVGLAKKGWHANLDYIIELDDERKSLLVRVESSKAEQNRLSASIPQIKKQGGDLNHIFNRVKELKDETAVEEARLKEVEELLKSKIEVLPNLPDEDLLSGEKENNRVIYEFGQKPIFNFPIKDHVQLAEGLGLVDYKRGAKISGSGTWVYTGLGAELEWALINFFVSEHLTDGYEMVLPPHLLNYESGYTAGQFPKFQEDVFWLNGAEPGRFMLPTAETALVNLHRNEILSPDELPKKYFAYTPCYRREAGSYRTEERGMIRGYQFNKVEMVQYTRAEDSDQAFEEMVNKAKLLVEKLGLHFRISKLAAGDCSHSMARTYDIEVWLPSMEIYKEVSSVSNARDYQARRGMIRYRDLESGKTNCPHLRYGAATSAYFRDSEQFQIAMNMTIPKFFGLIMRNQAIPKIINIQKADCYKVGFLFA